MTKTTYFKMLKLKEGLEQNHAENLKLILECEKAMDDPSMTAEEWEEYDRDLQVLKEENRKIRQTMADYDDQFKSLGRQQLAEWAEEWDELHHLEQI